MTNSDLQGDERIPSPADNCQKDFEVYFRSRPIAYQPGYVEIFGGSVPAAIIMNQLLFWHGKGARKGWIYKTIKEMYLETGLSRTQQDTAIAKLVSFGVLSVERMGWPRKRYFKPNIKALHQLISMHKPSKLTLLHPAIFNADNLHTNTESTDIRLLQDNTTLGSKEPNGRSTDEREWWSSPWIEKFNDP